MNTCSIAALVGLPNRALYSATKGAVYSLTLAMAADLLHEGVRVNCVTPGTTDTPWIRRLLDDSMTLLQSGCSGRPSTASWTRQRG